MIAIPAIDLIDGRCVRLVEGRYDRVTYYDVQPVEWARKVEAHGLSRLHIVDLHGARDGKVSNLAVLREIAGETRLRIDFGGGIRTADDVGRVLDAGADLVNVGSVAVNQREEFQRWIDTFGPERFVVAADAREDRVAAHGWQTSTEERVDTFIAGYASRGIGEFICTDIARDGRLEGPSIALYQRLSAASDVCIIASGGVRNATDMHELQKTGVCGAIVGKALFEGLLSLEELSEWAR